MRNPFFWQAWEEAKQDRYLRLVRWGWALFFLICWSVAFFMTQSDVETIDHLRKRYKAVAPLAAEMKALLATRGDLADMDPTGAALQAVADVGIDIQNIVISSTESKDGATQIRLTLDRLTLAQLTDTLEALRKRCDLHWSAFTLNRNPVDARLTDVTMVLTR